MTGRPPKLNETIEIRNDAGQIVRTLTRGERVIELMRSGAHFDHACTSAGITEETGYEYLRKADALRIRAHQLDIDTVQATEHERNCLTFAEGVAIAAGEAAIANGLQAQRLMRGGIPQVKTTTKVKYVTELVADPNDPENPMSVRREVEREETTVTEHTLPDGPMLRWWFERRFPKLYGRTLEILDPERVLSEEAIASSMADGLEEWLKTDAARRLADESAKVVRKEAAATATNGSNGRKKPKRMRDERGRIIREIGDEPET